MATISIEITDEQAEAFLLMTDDDGEKETVTEYVQRELDGAAKLGAQQKRQRDFDALSGEQKDKAIVEGKKV